MFFRKSKAKGKGGKGSNQAKESPNGHSNMSFQEWAAIAKQADIDKISKDSAHFYFRKNTAKKGGSIENFVGRCVHVNKCACKQMCM
jgi:transcription initiation factor TFIIIB Brf1 subunit/transcription initiation factor TFIIB